jgi:hypothetical protein
MGDFELVDLELSQLAANQNSLLAFRCSPPSKTPLLVAHLFKTCFGVSIVICCAGSS